MFNSLSCFIKSSFWDFKRTLLECKTHLIICTIALIIGLLIALGKDYSEVINSNNFIIVVLSGNTSPVPQFLRLVAWFIVVFLLVFATSFHFFAFIAIGYGGIILSSYILFRCAFKAIAANTLLGIINLIFYLLPTLLFIFCGVIIALRKIYCIVNFDCYRKCMINVACHYKSIKNAIIPTLTLAFSIALIYWLIIYLILLLFV